MIVRISTEGQYRLSSSALDRLNEIDVRLVDAAARADEESFSRLLDEMLALVRAEGTPLSPDEFLESDVVLPPPDTNLEEARELFQGEGVLPG